MTGDEAPQALDRCEEVWYPDGTIVLRAQDIYFRFYKGILAARSPIFADMFAIPQPADDDEQIEGCPIVFLHDTAEDVKSFLRVLHEPGFFKNALGEGKDFDFHLLAGVLRLSTKYEVSYWRQQAIAQLSLFFPTTLEQWRLCISAVYPKAFPYDTWGLRTVLLARELDVPSVLPAALFSIITFYPIEDILGLSNRNPIQFLPNGLDYIDVFRCFKAADQLRYDLTSQNDSQFARAFDKTALACLNLACRSAKWECFATFAGADNILDLRRWLSNEDSRTLSGVCVPCQNELRRAYESECQSEWGRLPFLLDLPEWDTYAL